MIRYAPQHSPSTSSSAPNRPNRTSFPSLLATVLVIGLCAAWTLPGAAQPTAHFSTCTTGTGTNATIIFPADASYAIGDEPIAVGDEIAVFTPAGHCAGSATWTGANLALTVWGQNAFTDGEQALSPGAPMTFRVWDASNRLEFGGEGAFTVTLNAQEPYYISENRFEPDGIYVVDSLQLDASPHASR